MKLYDTVIQHYRKICMLQGTKSLLWWDKEVNLPSNSTALRDEQNEVLELIIHQESIRDEFFENILTLESNSCSSLNEIQKRNVELLKKEIGLKKIFSKEFVARFSKVQSQCYNKFKKAKEEKNYKIVEAAFADHIVVLKERAQIIKESKIFAQKYASSTLYDVMIDADFDPGLTNTDLKNLFTPLKQFLVSNVDSIQEKRVSKINLSWPIEKQLTVSRHLCEKVGFNFSKGRLDVTPTHPFCGGSFGDTRLTTWLQKDDAMDAIMSTMHEVGHGIYEQNLPPENAFTPIGYAPSAALHESQSRFIENQISRSKAFIKYLSKYLNEDYDQLYKSICGKTDKGFLRVEADEVEYNLHIILRWEIEQMLVEGKIAAKDVPEVWNSSFKTSFGKDVPNDRLGCVQDIHWYGIGFGYFPSYAVGNIIASQLFRNFKNEFANWESRIENADMLFVNHWLSKQVHSLGSKYDLPNLCNKIFNGQKLTANALIEYLKEKFT